MVKIVAKQTVRQDKVDSFITLAKKLVEQTRKSDAGCIRYELFQDAKDPRILTFIEEWENQAALDKHMASVHFKEIFPQLGALCEKPGEINIYRKVE
jgi:quinol monooxygenase YgiN